MKKMIFLFAIFFISCKSNFGVITPENIFTVNSVNIYDDEFSDLLFLKEILQNKRIVVLSEATHQDGTALSAQGRIVRFLHEKMGFNLVLFENGFYIVNKASEFIQVGIDPDNVSIELSRRFQLIYNERKMLNDFVLNSEKVKIGGYDIHYPSLFKECLLVDFDFLFENHLKSKISKSTWDEYRSFICKLPRK